MCGIFATYGKHAISVAMHDVLNECLDGLRASFDEIPNIFFDSYAFLGSTGDSTTIGKRNISIADGVLFNMQTLSERYRLKSDNISSFYDTCLSELPHETIKQIASQVDGEFAIVVYNSNDRVMHAFRDPYGARPLFYGLDYNERIYFASEAKALVDVCTFIEQLQPGYVMTVSSNAMITHYERYNPLCLAHLSFMSKTFPDTYYYNNIRHLLTDAVRKRVPKDANCAIMLSGGLNSSLVGALVARESKMQVHTFTLGLAGSADLAFAASVANHINAIHHPIIITPHVLFDTFTQVIRVIESYDVTTVRAALGIYLTACHIAKENIHCVFTGDFADDVVSGHKYFNQSPNPISLHEDTVRLLGDSHFFTGLQSERCLSAYGLSPRFPFTDKAFVEFYVQLPPEMRMPDAYGKDTLRKAFEFDNIVPQGVLWRRKEVFCDAASSSDNPLDNMIREYVESVITDEEFAKKKYEHNTPHTKEALFYRKIFESFYRGHDIMIPYVSRY